MGATPIADLVVKIRGDTSSVTASMQDLARVSAQTGSGLSGITGPAQGASASITMIDREARKFIESLNDQVATLGKSKLELAEYRAAQLGVAAEAAPLIAQLKELGGSMSRAGSEALGLAESEAQVSTRLRDMVSRSLEAQRAMEQTAMSARDAATGIGAVGTSSAQVRETVASQTKAMIDAQRGTSMMNDEMQALRTTMAQGNATFATSGEQYARLDRAMATGKLSMQEYDAVLAALGRDEDKRLQSLGALTSKYDPLGAATRKLAQDQALLDDAYKTGKITTAQYQQTLNGIRVDQAVVELRRLAEQEAQLERTFRSGEISSRNYKKSLADIGTNRASLNDIAGGADKSAKAMEGFGFKTAGARKELVVLAHEAATGSWSNFGGSLLVLGERTDVLHKLLSPTGLALGVLAGVAAVFGLAAYKSAAEVSALNTAIAVTGNYAGGTAGSFLDMADRIGEANHNVGAAAVVLTGLVSSGRISSTAIEAVGEAALNTSKLTGQSADDVVKQFEKMGDGVVKFADEYDKRYHAISTAVYEQITALEAHGHAEEAQRVLGEAIAHETQSRITALHGDLNWIQQAWDDAGNAASNAWRKFSTGVSAALNILPMQKELQSRIDWKSGNLNAANFGTSLSDAFSGTSNDARIAELQTQIKKANDEAAAQEAQRRTQENGNTALRNLTGLETSLNKTNALAQALAQVRKEWNDLHAADPNLANLRKVDPTNALLAPDALKTLEDATRKKFEVKSGHSGQSELNAQISADVAIYEGYAKEREQILKASQSNLDSLHKQGLISDTDYINRSHDEQVKALQDEQVIAQLKADAASGRRALAERNKYLAQVTELAAKEKLVEQDRTQKLAELDAKAANDYVSNMQKQIDAAQQQDQGLRDQLDTFGMSKAAIDQLKAARADDAVAALEQGRAIAIMNGNLADTSGYDTVIAKSKELARALHRTADDQAAFDWKNEAKKAADDAVNQWKQAANAIENSISDALMRGFEKGKSFGQNLMSSLESMFKTLVLRPIIQPIAQGAASFFYPGGAQAAQGGGNNALGLLQNGSNLYSKGSSLYDTVSGWFGGGYGSAGSALGSSAIAGAGSSALAGGGAALGGLGAGIGGNVAAGAGTYSAGLVGANSYGFALGGSSGGLGLGGTLGSSAGLWYGGAGLLGGLAGGALFGNKGYSSMGGSLGAMGGLALGASSAVAGTAIGASLGSLAGPIGAVVGMALGSLLGSFIGGGETRYGASYATSDGKDVAKFAGPSGGDPASADIQTQIKTTYSSIESLANQLGGSVSGLGQYKASYEISPKKGNSFVSAGFTTGDDWYPDRVDLGGVKDSETVLADFQLQLQRSVISGLQKAGLDTPYASVLQGVDASKLSADDVTALLAELSSLKNLFDSFKNLGRDFDNLKNASTDAQLAVMQLAGGVDAFNTSATFFYQHFTTADQQAADQAKALNDQMNALGYTGIHTRDQFKALVESLDLSSDAGQKAYVSLLALAPAFDAVAGAGEAAVKAAYDSQSQALTSFRDQLLSFRQSLAAGDLSDLSPEAKYAASKSTYEDLLGKASAGDATAQAGLTSAAQDFLNASKAYNASSSQYQADLADVMKSIDLASSATDQQLDLMKQQVAGILDVDKSVQTLAQALAAYRSGAVVDGSHATGLYRVPFDGYVAELHRDERVLTAAEAKQLDARSSSGSVIAPAALELSKFQRTDNDAVVRELKAQREQNAKQAELIAKLLSAQLQQADTLARSDAEKMDQQTALLQQQRRPGQK
ncbi:phage tail length tape measure family protein [Caballeronia sp. KNU42]